MSEHMPIPEGCAIYIKTYCQHCGALLSHTREELGGKTFISTEVEPCSECLGTLMLANGGKDQ